MNPDLCFALLTPCDPNDLPRLQTSFSFQANASSGVSHLCARRGTLPSHVAWQREYSRCRLDSLNRVWMVRFQVMSSLSALKQDLHGHSQTAVPLVCHQPSTRHLTGRLTSHTLHADGPSKRSFKDSPTASSLFCPVGITSRAAIIHHILATSHPEYVQVAFFHDFSTLFLLPRYSMANGSARG